MRALARSLLVSQMQAHARVVAPAICADTDEGHLLSVIEYCLDRCDHYRISREYDVLRYLNLVLVFGLTFDRDALWASGPLSYSNPVARMDLLMDHALRSIELGTEEIDE
jgi:hypothetical protein